MRLIGSAVVLFLSDLQKDEPADNDRDEHDSDDYFRGHALRLLSQIPALLRHDDRGSDKTAEQDQNAAAERGEFPPVTVHAKLHELVVVDLNDERIRDCMLPGQFNLLSGDREVPIRCDALLDPDGPKRKTIDYDLAGSVRDHVGYGPLRVVEVAAIRFLTELQCFKVGFALDLDAEPGTCQRVAGLGVNLLDLKPCRTVLDIHDLRGRHAVFIGERKGDHLRTDIAFREHLLERVGSYRQIPELDKPVFIREEGILTVLCPDAEVCRSRNKLLAGFLGRRRSNCGAGFLGKPRTGFFLRRRVEYCANRLPFGIDQSELDICEGLAGVQIQLVDLQTGWLVRDVGGAGDVTVIVNGERERLRIQREAISGNGLLEGVGVRRKLIQDDLAVQICSVFEDDLAFGVRDLDDCLVYGLSGCQIRLLQYDMRLLIRAFEYDRCLVVSRDLDFDHFIRNNEARRRDNLLHIVSADREIDRNGVAVLIGRHGAVEQTVLVTDLVLSAFEHASGIGIVFLPDGDITLEPFVFDRVLEVHGVCAADGEREGFLDQVDRFVRDLELLQVVFAKGERGFGGRDTVLIRCQQTDERVLRDHLDRFSGIDSEHSAFERAFLEGHGGRIEELAGLLDLDRTGDALIGDGLLRVNDWRVLILIRQCDSVDRRVQVVAGYGLGFLNRVCPKREQACLGDAVFVRNDGCDNGSGGILHLEFTSGKAFDLVLRGVQLTVFGVRRGCTCQNICGFRDPDRALCGLVFQLKRCRFADLDDDGVRKPVNDIRFYSGQFLDVVRSRVQFIDCDRAVGAGRNLCDLLRTVRVLVDAELNACQRGAVISNLLDLQGAERRGVYTEARGCHDLCRGGTEEDLLQRVVRGNVGRDVVQGTGVLAGSGDRECLASRTHRCGDCQLLTLVAGVSGHGDAGGKTGGVQGIARIDVGELDGRFAGEVLAALGERQRSRRELDVMTERLLVPGHLKQFVRPGQNVLVTLLRADGVGMRLAVCEAVASGLTVFREPEPDRVGSRLPRLVFRETVRRVARIPVHQDRLKSLQCTGREYGGRRCRCVRGSMRVAIRMLDTITDLTGGLDPVLGRVQVLPLSVGVILQVVKSGVRLGFDFDGSLGIAGISECRRGHQCEEHEGTEQHGNEFLCCFHRIPFLREIVFPVIDR